MSVAHTMDPCAGDFGCLAAPAEFVRLRYFFGQRLGVVDLYDEQAYLVGKQHFHNLRAHGAGVLCGLDAERYLFPQGSAATKPTTLLRVRKGAALDACGREIVVGWDQCIDVAAWYAQHPAAQITQFDARATDTPAVDTNTVNLPLWVALCYRECPSDPSPAPRDPCSCGNEGCEFARIREGFELKLLTETEARLVVRGQPTPPDADLIAEEVLNGSIDDSLAALVASLASASCPDPPHDPCLLLSSFEAIVDVSNPSATRVTDITSPDNAIDERQSLLSTAVLQDALLRVLGSASDAGLMGSGPRFTGVTFGDAGADMGTLSIAIRGPFGALSRDPTAAPVQLTVTVSRFQDDGTWAAAAPDSITYVDAGPAHLDLTWNGGLADDGRYRVLIQSDPAQPPVDGRMRPLTPSTWARHIHLVKGTDGNLTLANSLF